jgi:hypothetical protein
LTQHLTVLLGPLSFLLLSGCDVAEPEETASSRGFDRPPLHVLVVEATSDYDPRPVRVPLSEGTVTDGVTISTSIVLHFDRFLLPQKVIRQTICIRAGTDPVASAAECTDPGGLFLEPEYNPVTRSATFRLEPAERLAPDTLYRITVFAPPTADVAGFFAFDGAALERPYVFDFRTQPAGGAEQDEVAPTSAAYCAAIACFAACAAGDTACREACRPSCIEDTCSGDGDLFNEILATGDRLLTSCAFGQCHAPSIADPAFIAMGLDLSSGASVLATAIGKTSHLSQTGEASTQGDLGPVRFGRAMPIVEPGNPGNSFLLYKLLINPLNYPRPGGARDVAGFQREIDRLRKSAIPGLPMPAQIGSAPAEGIFPASFDPDGSINYRHAQLIHAWIAAGAIVDPAGQCP